jgi:peroxiredoxin
VGTPAPAFRLPALEGGERTLDDLRARGKPVLLLFSSPSCAPCVELMPEAARWQRIHASKLTIALLNRGTADAVQAKAAAYKLADLLMQTGNAANDVAAAYLAGGTPSAVLIDVSGKIASPLAAGAEAVRRLVERAVAPIVPGRPAEILPAQDPLRTHLRRRAPIAFDGGAVHRNGAHANNGRPALKPAAPLIGAQAPAVRLPDLDGEPVDLARFRGATTLLLFWNPACGFCRRMAGDLRAVTSQPAPGAPQVVLISTGAVEANLALDLPVPILLDESFHTGFAFGASGTPSAILLDAEGRVASPVVTGAPAVLALAQGKLATSQPVAQPLAA